MVLISPLGSSMFLVRLSKWFGLREVLSREKTASGANEAEAFGLALGRCLTPLYSISFPPCFVWPLNVL